MKKRDSVAEFKRSFQSYLAQKPFYSVGILAAAKILCKMCLYIAVIFITVFTILKWLYTIVFNLNENNPTVYNCILIANVYFIEAVQYKYTAAV